MKRFSRITLAAAVAAVMAGGIGTTLQVNAGPALDAGGSWVDNDPRGDVLLFPYYTVRNDANGNPFRTSFTVTNTDTTHSVVLKFRLRDHVDSQDVLDFMWILSPGDEMVAFMDRDPNSNQPRVNFPADETSCRVPWLAGQSTFTAPGGAVSAADAQEGHLEIVPVAWALTDGDPDTDTLPATPGDGDLAVHGANQDCDALSDIFLSSADGAAIQTAWDNTHALTAMGSVLRGTFAITNPLSGYSGGGSALAIANWAPGPLLYAQNNAIATATQLDGEDTEQWDHPHLGDSATTATIDSGAIGAESVINNWSVNPANGVGVDWVITYYTKYLWRDAAGFYGDDAPYDWPTLAAGDANLAAAQGRMVYDVTLGALTIAAANSPWTQAIGVPVAIGGSDDPNGGVCMRADLNSDEILAPTVWDREEDTAALQGGISPGPESDSYDLCNEANVVSFERGNERRPVLRDADAVVIDAATLNLPFGWADLLVNGTGPGVAVGGFAYVLRDLGDPTLAFGSINAHDLD